MNIDKTIEDNEKIKEISEIYNEINLIVKYKVEFYKGSANSKEIID